MCSRRTGWWRNGARDGLIFAAIGQGLVSPGEPVIAPEVYLAIVVMVVVTILVTPPLHRPLKLAVPSDVWHLLELFSNRQ